MVACYCIFCVETLTIATWLCGLELVISLDVRKALQSYFLFLVLKMVYKLRNAL